MTLYSNPGRQTIPKARPEGSFPCLHSDCTYVAKEASKLHNHTLAHGKTKTFVCPHPGCTYRSFTKMLLKKHSIRHTGLVPFPCPLAGCEVK